MRQSFGKDPLAKLEAEVKANPDNRNTKKTLDREKKDLAAAKRRIANAKKRRRGGNTNVAQAELTGSKIFARVSRRRGWCSGTSRTRCSWTGASSTSARLRS